MKQDTNKLRDILEESVIEISEIILEGLSKVSDKKAYNALMDEMDFVVSLVKKYFPEEVKRVLNLKNKVENAKFNLETNNSQSISKLNENSNYSRIKRYTKECEDADLIIFNRHIVNKSEVVLEAIVKKNSLKFGSCLVIENGKKSFTTMVENLDFQSSEIKINNDNSIYIMEVGRAKCRHLLDEATKDQQVCIKVQGDKEDFDFIMGDELVAAKYISLDEYTKYKLNKKNMDRYEVKKTREIDSEAIVLISQFTQVAANSIDDLIIWKKQLINILNIKRERAVYEKKYVLTLKANIIFYLNTWNEVKKIVESWLTEKNIPSECEVNVEISRIQQKFKLDYDEVIRYKNGQPLNVEDINLLRKYEKFNSTSELIDQLEFDYMYSYTRGELMYNLLGVFMKNKQMFTKLFLYSYEEITEEVFNNLDVKVNMCLNNIKWDI